MNAQEFLKMCYDGEPHEVEAAINVMYVNAKDRFGRTALMNAAARNPNPEVISILIKGGTDIHAKAIGDTTALTFAAWNNPSSEIISLLLKMGEYDLTSSPP